LTEAEVGAVELVVEGVVGARRIGGWVSEVRDALLLQQGVDVTGADCGDRVDSGTIGAVRTITNVDVVATGTGGGARASACAVRRDGRICSIARTSNFGRSNDLTEERVASEALTNLVPNRIGGNATAVAVGIILERKITGSYSLCLHAFFVSSCGR